MSRLLSSFVAVMLFLGATPVFAQEEPSAVFSETGEFWLPSVGAPSDLGPLSCFDYYRFGSVQADLQTNVSETIPGAILNFSGVIENSNPYPLVDGLLYVKIFKRDASTLETGDGNEVIDQFVVAEDITLNANDSAPVSYDWMVPTYAEGGDYYAAYFFVTSDRYNLMGLSFTDDVVGNTADFSVTASSSVAKLSKVDTRVNDLDHRFAAVPLTFDASETVVVTTTITNPRDETISVPLQWNQYAWDAMDDDNHRNTKTEVITLAANETKEVSYTVKEMREPVVLVTAVTEDRGVTSYLNIRYVRDNIPETRINFPGISQFPLVNNSQATLFACAHSTNVPRVEGNTLTLQLTDRNGDTIHKYRYEGAISGAMGGYGETFVPATNYDYVLLTATLERQGVVVEEVEIVYDCQNIDPDSCFLEETSSKTLFSKIFTDQSLLITGAVVLLLLLFLVWSVHRRYQDSTINTMKTTTKTNVLSILVILFVMPLLFHAGSKTAHAKSVTWSDNTSAPQGLMYFWNCSDGSCNNGATGWEPGLSSPSVSITYKASVYDNGTGVELSDGASVPIGTVLRIEPDAFNTTDIVWFGTGRSQDSPYGHWRSGATAPPFACLSGDQSASNVNVVGLGTVDVFNPLSVNPPTTSSNANGSAATLTALGGNLFRVDSAGAITLNSVFSATYGEFYYRYRGNQRYFNSWPITPGVCYGNQVAMEKITGYTQNWIICLTGGCGPQYSYTREDYRLLVPEQTISFNLTAVGAANQAPDAPTINGPTSGAPNTSYTFTLNAADSDGDQVRYGIDLDNNGSVDQWLPGGGYVTSNTSLSFNDLWGSDGSYTFQARTQDSNGAYSGWSSHTITISTPPSPPVAVADLTIDGSDGPLNVSKAADMVLGWTHSNAGTCNIYGDGLPGGQLNNVVATGSHTIPGGSVGAGVETYALTCTSANDSVNVTVTNTDPNPPTIIQTAGNNEEGSPQTFSFSGTDPDGDQVYYEIDWDNDGSIDATTPGSGYVPSGTARTGVYTWPSSGNYLVRARTVDTDTARSTWGQLPITIDPGPPPTASIEVRVDGGGWSTSNQTVGAESDLDIRWSSTFASNCNGSGPGFSTGGSTGSTDTSINTPSAGNSSTFSVNCDGAVASVIVSAELADLSIVAASLDVDASSFNPGSMSYTNASVRFTHSNRTSLSAVPATTATVDHNGGFTGTAPGLSGGTEYTSQVTIPITDVPVGAFSADLTVNEPQSVSEKTRGNNTQTVSNAVPPPNPGLFITADRIQVRDGDPVDLNWGASIVYPMDCRVEGPGVGGAGVNALNGVSLPGNTNTAGIVAKSEYILTCNEPISNTDFTASVTVETVGSVEEI